MIEPVRVSVSVPLPVQRTYDRFACELRDWWPREYTWSREVLHDFGMEPRGNGLCFEIGPYGFRCDWGRVLEWAPPDRLRLAWQIGPRREPVPNPLQSSTVTLRLTAEGPRQTGLALVHDDFDRHGAEGSAYRDAMASSHGWPLILQRFVEAAS